MAKRHRGGKSFTGDHDRAGKTLSIHNYDVCMVVFFYHCYIVFRCHICDETFTRQYNLSRHLSSASHKLFDEVGDNVPAPTLILVGTVGFNSSCFIQFTTLHRELMIRIMYTNPRRMNTCSLVNI